MENIGKRKDLERYECIMLDLDETIFEFRLSSRNGLSSMKTFVEVLENVDTGVLEEELWQLDRKDLPSVLSGTIAPREYRKIRLRMLIMKHGYIPSEQEITRLESIYTKSFEREMKLCEGAGKFLEYCAETGKSVAIITNGDKLTQHKTISKLGIENAVDMVLTPSNEREMKPSAHLFDTAVSSFGISKDRSIMIGDSWHHDILGALNAGIRAIWINRRNESVPKTMDVLEISSMGELI